MKKKYLIDLPEYYVVWYSNKGFPKEGQQLQLIWAETKWIRGIDSKY
jgi:uncharacterized protein (DUF3820 family)